jgi:hypothetical protein
MPRHPVNPGGTPCREGLIFWGCPLRAVCSWPAWSAAAQPSPTPCTACGRRTTLGGMVNLNVTDSTFVQEARHHCGVRSATHPGMVAPCILAAFLKGKASIGDFSFSCQGRQVVGGPWYADDWAFTHFAPPTASTVGQSPSQRRGWFALVLFQPAERQWQPLEVQDNGRSTDRGLTPELSRACSVSPHCYEKTFSCHIL